jgi:hypothetical protein
MSKTKVTPRYVRHRKRSRIRRSKDFKALIAALQTTLSGTGAGGAFTAAAGTVLTKAAHGFEVGDGPFLITNSGGALPSPGVINKLYWVVGAPSASTFELATDEDGDAITWAGAGTGTHTITKASTLDAVYELLKKHGQPVLKGATDVDSL